MVSTFRRSISATGYATYCKCPQKWYQRYCRDSGDAKPADPQTPSLLAGNGVHAVIEHATRAMVAGKPVSAEESIGYAYKVVNDLVAAYGLTSGDTLGDLMGDSGELLDTVLQRVNRVGTWFIRNELPHLHPLEPEVKFEVELPGSDSGCGLWTVNGKIDLIQGDSSQVHAPATSGLTITDWKLSSRAPSMEKADLSSQLSIYAMAHWLKTGKVPEKLELFYIIDTTRIHTLQRITHRTVEQCQRQLQRMLAVCRAIDRSLYLHDCGTDTVNDAPEFPPADPETIEYGKPVCSVSRCIYFNQCQYGGK